MTASLALGISSHVVQGLTGAAGSIAKKVSEQLAVRAPTAARLATDARAFAAPEGRCLKENAVVLWSERYVMIRGEGLYFYNPRREAHTGHEEPRASSIASVRGYSVVSSQTQPSMLDAFTAEEFVITLQRQGETDEGSDGSRAAGGSAPAGGPPPPTRFKFKERAMRDRFYCALVNMCADIPRPWHDHSEPTPHRDTGISEAALARRQQRVAEVFWLAEGGEGFGMRVNEQGIVIGFRTGPAEGAGVVKGARILRINGVELSAGCGMSAPPLRLDPHARQQFDMLFPGKGPATVKLMFELLDYDCDGMLGRDEYAFFCHRTEDPRGACFVPVSHSEISDERWREDCRRVQVQTAELGAANPAEGLQFCEFVRLYADPRSAHFGRSSQDWMRLIWEPATIKWRWADASLLSSFLSSSVLATVWLSKGSVAEVATQLADALRMEAPATARAGAMAAETRGVVLHALISPGLTSGRLTRAARGAAMTASLGWGSQVESKWFVLREGLSEGTYFLCCFGAEESEAEPEETIQLTKESCDTCESSKTCSKTFSVWGHSGGAWKQHTLTAESEAAKQMWVQHIKSLRFAAGDQRPEDGDSRTYGSPAAALQALEARYRGEALRRLASTAERGLSTKNYGAAGGALRTLAVVEAFSRAQLVVPLRGIQQLVEDHRRAAGEQFGTLLDQACDLFAECMRASDANAPAASTGTSYSDLRAVLDDVVTMGPGLRGVLEKSVLTAQFSRLQELSSRLEEHFDRLCADAKDAETTPAIKARLLQRSQRCADELWPRHFPGGSEDVCPLGPARLQAAWACIEADVERIAGRTTQIVECATVSTADKDLTRSLSSSVEDNARDLAHELSLLQHYQAAFSSGVAALAAPHAGGDGSVEAALEPDQAPGAESSGLDVLDAYDGPRERLHAVVCAHLHTLKARLGGVCEALSAAAALTVATPEALSAAPDVAQVTPEACVAFERSLETLDFYRHHVDGLAVAAGCFGAAHSSMSKAAERLLDNLVAHFNHSLREASDPARVEALLSAVEQLASVPLLAQKVWHSAPPTLGMVS